jgi:hypothetical protein
MEHCTTGCSAPVCRSSHRSAVAMYTLVLNSSSSHAHQTLTAGFMKMLSSYALRVQ